MHKPLIALTLACSGSLAVVTDDRCVDGPGAHSGSSHPEKKKGPAKGPNQRRMTIQSRTTLQAAPCCEPAPLPAPPTGASYQETAPGESQ